jgi:hypothetical protein
MAVRKGRRPAKRRTRPNTAKLRLPALPEKHKPGWLDGLDRRQRYARALIARRDQLVEDLGGMDRMSYQQRTMAERTIFLEALVKEMEERHARGEPIDLNSYTHACNTMTGLLKALGLQRAAKPVETLHAYMARKAESGGTNS